jgi:hypothetical protein
MIVSKFSGQEETPVGDRHWLHRMRIQPPYDREYVGHLSYTYNKLNAIWNKNIRLISLFLVKMYSQAILSPLR